MKKYILSSFLALASTVIYAQSKVATTGTSLSSSMTCNDSPENPIIGKTYTYKASATPTGGTYHIFATDKTEFIKGGNLQTSGAYGTGTQKANWITAGAGYNDASNTSGSVDIVWSAKVANPSFVVMQYIDPTGCKSDNLKVYKVEPKNAFYIELRNLDSQKNIKSLGVSVDDVCLGKVQSASYDVATNKMVYNYGKQSLFYELIVANYDKTFKPTFKLTGLQAGQTAKLRWGVSASDISSNRITVTEGTEFSLPEITADTTVTPSNGVSIYLELEIDNGTHEGLTDQVITLAADAVSGTLKNVDTSCVEKADFADVATQTLKARPTVTPASGTFLQP